MRNLSILILAAVLLFAAPSTLKAQSQDVHDVAKCLVAENITGSDWSAILDVLKRRADRAGVSIGRMARAYCAVHRARNPTARQLRIRSLPSNDVPQQLRERYERALVAAQRGGSGTCKAQHWGASSGEDLARATRLGWKIENCGRTSNAFWALPRLGFSRRRT